MDLDGELDLRLACQEKQRAIIGSEVSSSQILLNEAVSFIVLEVVQKLQGVSE